MKVIEIMFEKISRAKVRFDSPKGLLTVEDLWDLPLTTTRGQANLDDIARALHKQLKNGDDVSFVDTAKKSDPVVQLKFDVVKHIIEVRLAENEANANRRSKAEKRAVLMEALANQEAKALANKTPEEIRAELEALAD